MSTSQIPILPPSTEANQNSITIEQSPEVSPRRSLRRHKPNINYKDFGDESDANESEEFDINEEHKNHMSKKRNRSRNACKKICNKMNKNSVTSDKDRKYESDLQAKIEWNNCAYRHIAGMLDILNEIDNPKWRKFIENKIRACKHNIENGMYLQF